MNAADRKILRRAAKLLDMHAGCLFDSEVIRAPSHPNYGKVEEAVVRDEIDEHRALARRLRSLAHSSTK